MLFELLSELSGQSLLTLCGILLLITWLHSSRKVHGLPPSPGIALPMVGHLYLLQANPRKQFLKWGEKYGPIFSLYMGNRLMVVLHDFEVIKEAFVKHGEYFSERPKTFVTHSLTKDKGLLTSGPHWREQRKITVEILRDLGLGNSVMEEKIQEEVTRLIQFVEDENGEPFNPRDHVMQSVSNITSALMFGEGFRPDDPVVAECVRLIGQQVSNVEGTAALNFFPFLRYLPGDLFGLQKACDTRDQLERDLIRKQVALRKQSMKGTDYEGKTADFITGYLKSIEIQRRQGIHDSQINEENMIAVMDTLLAAGTETTSTTICWAILYLLHHPKVADRCHKEIMDIVGSSRRPAVSDRSQLQYVEATILEIQRIANITPYGIFHTVSQNITLRNYQIPKGAIVTANLDSVQLSSKIWGDPFNFRPERFLDESGGRSALIRREELIPFSIGRRSCLGEPLARMELFLFVSTLIQKFQFRAKDGCSLPPLIDKFGLSCSPLPYEVCMVRR